MALDSESQPTEIRVREDASENLRHFVLDCLVEMNSGPSSIRDTLFSMEAGTPRYLLVWICEVRLE
jgi:hypothetical protein